ncbi:hypothetical protein FOA52_001088 [Chlamydomonas sp. UWO 241]|nr:hypothetical protein FOA52_001088 [Chlamydomonas sp. UWO 241]
MPYTIYYHNKSTRFWGRTLPIVLALETAGAEYTVKEPTDGMPEGVGFAVPVVTLACGHSTSQMPVILDVLGERLGLGGSTPEQKVRCKQLIMDMMDMSSEAIAGKFEKDKPARADKWLSYLEKKLAAHKFLVSDEPTVADFVAMFALLWVDKLFEVPNASTYPKITAYRAACAELPAMKKIEASGVPALP